MSLTDGLLLHVCKCGDGMKVFMDKTTDPSDSEELMLQCQYLVSDLSCISFRISSSIVNESPGPI